MLKLALFSLLLSPTAFAADNAQEDQDLFARSQAHLAKFHSKVLAEDGRRSDSVVIKKSAIRKNGAMKEKASAE